jgi:chromosome segregation ATPase
VQLQENRLATLGRQYDDARRKVLDAQQGEAEVEQRLQQLSAGLRTAAPDERDAIETAIPGLKSEMARHQARTVQLRADETAAYNALAGEQQRWAAFNDRLETIERNLGQAALTPP